MSEGQKKGGSFSRAKGQRAERAVIHLLQPVVNKVCAELGMDAPMLERNLMQSHKGGHDVVGLSWMALEVKHHESLAVEQWWEQTKQQASKLQQANEREGRQGEVLPVLIYKQNNVKFRVRMFGYVQAGAARVRCPVEVSVDSFVVWFENRLRFELSAVVGV